MQKSLVFFSYARFEQMFAIDLSQKLQNAGVNVWIDQIDIEAGREWDLEVEKALERSSCLLFLATKASIKSKNVLDEVNYALSKGKRVVPLIVEKCEIPFRLQRLHYVDFTINYDIALNQLISTLKRESKEEIPQKVSFNTIKQDEEIADTNQHDTHIKIKRAGSFVSIIKKPLFIWLSALNILGILLFIGNVQQIVKVLPGYEKSNSRTLKSKNQDNNRIDTGLPSNLDTVHLDKTMEKTESIQTAGLNKGFESPPAHVIKGMQSENNPYLGVASIKIQDSIAWSETIFSKEEKNKILQLKKQTGYSDDAMMYRMYDGRYLKQSDQIFELRRYEEDIDPCFDITLLNKGQSPQILSRIGIEIMEAYFTVISLGSSESMKVNVMGRYQVEFPSPEKINIYGDIINMKKNNLILQSKANYIYIRRSNNNDTTPIKTTKGKLVDPYSLGQTLDFSYADLPKTVMIDLNDPIYMDQNKAFRFLLRITNSKFIPTSTLIRFVFKTDKGIRLSKPVYLLKP